jgi:integrase
MNEEHSLNAVKITEVTIVNEPQRYGNDLFLASIAAEQTIHNDVFVEYHKNLTPNTIKRQLNDLESFCAYLEEAKAGKLDREAKDLYSDPHAWQGIQYTLLKGYIKWAESKGYSIGTINIRLSTLRQYCKLAGPKPEGAGILKESTLVAILTVRGSGGKKARNIDATRKELGVPTRIGTKKAKPTDVATYQALELKKTSTTATRKQHTDYQDFLEARDALIMGLLIEHSMRCGEVAALNVEDINLANNFVRFDRRKTDLEEETHQLKTHTRMAAERYLKLRESSAGPLFVGRKTERMTERAIHYRVRTIGKVIGIENLSPHDLRHFWTYDALRNKTPIDKVKKGGGWKSTAMVLRYAERSGIANEGVNITEE